MDHDKQLFNFFFRKKETLSAYFIFGMPSKLPLEEEPGQTGNIYG